MTKAAGEVTANCVVYSSPKRHWGLHWCGTFQWTACLHRVYILKVFLVMALMCMACNVHIDFFFNQRPLGKQTFPRILILQKCEGGEQRDTAVAVPEESSIYLWCFYPSSAITPPAQQLQHVWYHRGKPGRYWRKLMVWKIFSLCYHIPCLNTWNLKQLTSKSSFLRYYIWTFLPQASFFWAISVREGTRHLLDTAKALSTRMTCCINCGHLFKGLEDQTRAGAWPKELQCLLFHL